jgi:hypothetical protein
MPRLMSLLLAVLLAAISTGGVGYLHELQHHHRDAGSARFAGISNSDDDDLHEHACALCATLHMPTVPAGYVPVLICLGLFVAFLTQIAPPPVRGRIALPIDCRGPPANR